MGGSSIVGTRLQPASRRGAEVQERGGLCEEVVFFVELHQLEGCAGAVPLLLRQVVELVCGAAQAAE